MKYDLTAPCVNCPFRTDIKPFITAGRVREILRGGADFACHKTCDYSDEAHDDDGELDAHASTRNATHCAGVLIILEKEEQPHQMMRIAERLRMYDASKLKMDAPVYDSIDEAIEAHGGDPYDDEEE